MPAFWALKNGKTKTATSIHELKAKLDDGDILLQKEVAITLQDTWGTLVRKTKAAGAKALVEAIRQIKSGEVQCTPNREEATYFSFPTSQDAENFRVSGRRFF